MRMPEIQKMVHQLAVEKGWYDPPKSDLESIMLMVSELSEAVEEVRKGSAGTYHVDGKPEGVAIELADCVIRIMDYCESRGINLQAAIFEKHDYNKSRPYRHGKKI